MCAAPDFSDKTVQILMARACMICCNPECSTVTLGPSDAIGSLAIKLGEAAHIRAARPGPRFDDNMTDQQRAEPENGIWLCASCHAMIDKNNGADFSRDTLLGWKQTHNARSLSTPDKLDAHAHDGTLGDYWKMPRNCDGDRRQG